jgi:hypothetical protein
VLAADSTVAIDTASVGLIEHVPSKRIYPHKLYRIAPLRALDKTPVFMGLTMI